MGRVRAWLAVVGCAAVGLTIGTAASAQVVAVNQVPVSVSVILVRDDLPFDAAVARSMRGPVILVPGRGDLPPGVRERVGEIEPDSIVVMGGVSAISEGVVDQFQGIAPLHRVAGADRLETALALQESRGRASYRKGVVVLAAAGSPVDLALAARVPAELLIPVPSSGVLPPVLRAALDRSNPDEIVVVGGSSALSDDAVGDVVAGRSWSRLAGRDRAGTALEVAARRIEASTTLVLARGSDAAISAWPEASDTLLIVPDCGSVPDELLASHVVGRAWNLVVQSGICPAVVESVREHLQTAPTNLSADVDGDVIRAAVSDDGATVAFEAWSGLMAGWAWDSSVWVWHEPRGAAQPVNPEDCPGHVLAWMSADGESALIGTVIGYEKVAEGFLYPVRRYEWCLVDLASGRVLERHASPVSSAGPEAAAASWWDRQTQPAIDRSDAPWWRTTRPPAWLLQAGGSGWLWADSPRVSDVGYDGTADLWLLSDT